jgi:hypothetical protein
MVWGAVGVTVVGPPGETVCGALGVTVEGPPGLTEGVDGGVGVVGPVGARVVDPEGAVAGALEGAGEVDGTAPKETVCTSIAKREMAISLGRIFIR